MTPGPQSGRASRVDTQREPVSAGCRVQNEGLGVPVAAVAVARGRKLTCNLPLRVAYGVPFLIDLLAITGGRD